MIAWAAPVVLLALGSGVEDPQNPAAISAEELVRRVVQRSKSTIESGVDLQYTFLELQDRDKLHRDGTSRERTLKLYRVTPSGGKLYTEFLERNGEAISGEDLKKERARKAAFQQKLQKGEAGLFDYAHHFRFDKSAAARFQYQVSASEVASGRSCYVLEFEPAQEAPEPRNRPERIVGLLRGRAWIDSREYEIVRAEGELTDSVGFGPFGIFGSVSNLHFELSQVRLAANAWFPESFSCDLKVTVFFFLRSDSRRYLVRWSEYERVETSR